MERTNEEWLAALRGPEHTEALEDLRAVLVRGLGYALSDRPAATEVDIQDFASDALLNIMAALDTFRRESRFTTWAQKIAVHVAFTELRRRRWRDISLDDLLGDPESDFFPDTLADSSAGREQEAVQSSLLQTVRQTIAEELTTMQRRAMVAIVIYGMPLSEVADRMDTNRNALYKLLHDARQRLKMRLLDDGVSDDGVLVALALPVTPWGRT